MDRERSLISKRRKAAAPNRVAALGFPVGPILEIEMGESRVEMASNCQWRQSKVWAAGWRFLALLAVLSVAVSPAFAESDDLPKRGASQFDRFVQEIGGAANLPPDFNDLIDLLKEKSGAPILRSQIPFGRSLNRHATDYDLPRDIIFVNSLDASSDNPSRRFSELEISRHFDFNALFIGYSPRENMLEVLSYNEELGRMEFQLVTDYGHPGLTKVFYAPRKLCLSCHQNAGPIWSMAGWSESGELAKLSKGAYWRDPRNRIRNTQGSIGEEFEKAVVATSNYFVAQHVLDSLCPSSGKCRELMVANAIGAEADHPKYEKAILDLRKDWPSEGFMFSDPLFLDRPAGTRVTGRLDPRSRRDLRLLPAKNNPLGVSEFRVGSSGYASNSSLDELFSKLFTVGELQALSKAAGGDRKLEKSLKSPEVARELRAKTIDRRAIFRTVLEQADSKVQISNLVSSTKMKGFAPVRLLEEEVNVMQSRVGLLRNYCAACHSVGGGSFAFMSGTDQDILTRFEDPKIVANIRQRLATEAKSGQMPPPKSESGRRLLQNPSDRASIIRWLDELSCENNLK